MPANYVLVVKLGDAKVWVLPELVEKLGIEAIRRLALDEIIPSRRQGPSPTQSKAWYRQKLAEMQDTRYCYGRVR